MTEAKQGDTVRVHYTGRLAGGDTFDSSRPEGREPLEFQLGAGMVIPGFDAGVTGMTVGESKTVTIPVDQAYGPKREELIVNVPLDQMPEGFEPTNGAQLLMQSEHGQQPVVVVGTNETHVQLDANHALAGEDLTFDLELVEIVAAEG